MTLSVPSRAERRKAATAAAAAAAAREPEYELMIAARGNVRARRMAS